MLKQNNIEEAETVSGKEVSTEEQAETLPYYCASDKNSKTYKKFHKKRKHRKKHLTKKKKIKRVIIAVICIVLSIIIAGIGSLFVIRQIGKNKFFNNNNVKINAIENAEINSDGNEIEYKGKKYIFNENVISVLCMGIDKEISKTETYGENGQADAIFILTIDVSNGNVNIIPVNRDTMVDVNTYSQTGVYAGIENQQICLAYSYGNGEEKSCKNVAESVSRLLYGVPVNSYFAIDLDAVEKINDICGGATVVPNETFSYFGTTLTKGVSTNLTNSQAKAFVRYRNQSKLNSNVLRMQRQKMFLNSALSKITKMVKKNISVIKKVYTELSPYSYTNIDLSQTTFLATKVVSINKNLNVKYRTIKGNVEKGKYTEFKPNEEQLFELVLDVYYKEK